jgi:hypothetical protein
LSATILFANNASSSLAAPITASAVSAVLAPGTGVLFPNPTGAQFFMLTFSDELTQTLREIVKVTAISGDTIAAMVRAQDGTTAQNFATGAFAQALITAGELQDIAEASSAGATAQPGIAAGAGLILTGPTTLAGAPVPVSPGTALAISGNALNVQFGTTSTTAAVGDDARFVAALQRTNNLSDLSSISVSRANLGLGSAALLNTSGVLQPTNNLSDLTSASVARTNLGLGSAALLAAGGANGAAVLDASGNASALNVLATDGVTSQTLAQLAFNATPILYRAKLNGLKSDGIRKMDITTTAGSNIVSSASYNFTSSDIGKSIGILSTFPATFSSGGISIGPGASSGALNGTITSVSSGNAILSVTAATSISSTGYAQFGTPDDAALTALISTIAESGGGVINFEGLTVISNTVVGASNVSFSGVDKFSTALIWISSSDMPNTATSSPGGLIGYGTASSANPWENIAFSKIEMDLSLATNATYTVQAKAIQGQYFKRFTVTDCWIHDTPATGVGTDFPQENVIARNIIENCGRRNGGSNLGGAGLGIGVGGSNPESIIVAENTVININGSWGIFFESEFDAVAVNTKALVTSNIVFVSNPSGSSCGGIGDCGCSDFNAIGNTVTYVGSVTSFGNSGIASRIGTITPDTAGVKGLISGNVITGGFQFPISVNYQSALSSSTACEYQILNNKVDGATDIGIFVFANATIPLQTIQISGNFVARSAQDGIAISSSGGTIQDVILTNNILKNNGQGGASNNTFGITLSGSVAYSRVTLTGNVTFDDQVTKTQTYGLGINATITGAVIQDNNFQNNKTGSINIVSGSITGWIANNPGYNPLGPLAVTPAASPWTYTAGSTPEVLYLNGGTVSSVVKNSITLASATGTQVNFQPGETAVITYSSAPTAVTDRR